MKRQNLYVKNTNFRYFVLQTNMEMTDLMIAVCF